MRKYWTSSVHSAASAISIRSRKLSMPTASSLKPDVPGCSAFTAASWRPRRVCSDRARAFDVVFWKSEPGGSDAQPVNSDTKPIPNRTSVRLPAGGPNARRWRRSCRARDRRALRASRIGATRNASVRSSQMDVSDAEESEQPDEDQVDGDDVVEHPRRDQDRTSRRAATRSERDSKSCSRCGSFGQIGAAGHRCNIDTRPERHGRRRRAFAGRLVATWVRCRFSGTEDEHTGGDGIRSVR